MDAIKLFHGEVSEDVLMKEKQFEGLRTKLLKGAADFYGRLEELLKGQTDRESREALGKAYVELAELTSKIGDQTKALDVHRKALAVHRALASEPGADIAIKLEVARGLTASGWLERSTGDIAWCARIVRAGAERWRRKSGRSQAWLEQAQGVLGTAYSMTGNVLAETGDPAGARAAYDKALAIRQKLADGNPSDLDFAAKPGGRPQQHWSPGVQDGRSVRALAGLPRGAADPAKAGRRPPRRHRVPA